MMTFPLFMNTIDRLYLSSLLPYFLAVLTTVPYVASNSHTFTTTIYSSVINLVHPTTICVARSKLCFPFCKYKS